MGFGVETVEFLTHQTEDHGGSLAAEIRCILTRFIFREFLGVSFSRATPIYNISNDAGRVKLLGVAFS